MDTIEREVDELILMIEPSTDSLVKIRLDFLPYLERVSVEKDPFVAARATYLIGHINDPSVKDLIYQAAKSRVPQVRMAVAAAARKVAQNLSVDIASELLMPLIEDRDVSVRKIAIKSCPQEATPALRNKLDHRQTIEPNQVLKALIAEVTQRWSEIKD